MQILNALESECVVGGALNPTISKVALFTITVGAVGGFLTGDFGGGILYGVMALIAAGVFINIGDPDYANWPLGC